MDKSPKELNERLKRRVQRHSPDRLLRRPVVLASGVMVSAEKHRSRIVVRLDFPPVKDAD